MSVEYLALDIETLEKPMPPEVWEAKRNAVEEYNKAQYKKPETIAEHIKDDLEKFKTKWKFSREGAQILCIGVGFFDADGKMVDGWCEPSDNEAQVLRGFTSGFPKELTRIGGYAPGIWPTIYTFNGDGFDWPHIVRACSEHEVYLPFPLKPRHCTDLMKYPFERFCANTDLDGICALHGIPEVPAKFKLAEYPQPDGSMVAEMWNRDKLDLAAGVGTPETERVRRYCLSDVWKVGTLAGRIRKIFE